LLLDTCVYIDVLQGNTPPEVDALLTRRTLNHLAVCVAELTHGLGRLDPRHPGTEAVSRTISGVVTAIPPHRLEAASADVVIEAGILAGLVFRLCGLASGHEVAVLNDAIIYLHAVANGLTVLTRNARDFDAMNQVLPDGRVLFYDRIE
jgi:predicted nucleic acid-binding protein